LAQAYVSLVLSVDEAATLVDGGVMERRAAWFDLGAQAFAAARPGAPHVYCCPLCIRGFEPGSSADLSLEDVPPKSVGGKPLLLTCTRCNNTHGTLLDSHLKAGAELSEVLEGTRETWGRLRVGDDRMTVKGTVFAENNHLVEVPGKGNPPERDAVQTHLESLTSGDEFHFELSLRYDEWKERLAWLRVAYLYLSALLGYTFVLREVLNPIRDQFNHPSERIVPQVIRTLVDPTPGDFIVSVSQPAELVSFAVKLQRWMFFFPGFVDTEDFYARLEQLPDRGQLSATGKPLDIPTEPRFECDFHPELAQYLAQQQAGSASNTTPRIVHVSNRGVQSTD
jgi:hypothetical protein